MAVLAAVGSVLLSAQAHAVLAAFHQRTAHLCDGSLPMPASSYVYAWSGVAAAVVAAVGVALVGRAAVRPLGVVLVVILALAVGVLLVSAGWTVWDVYQDARPVARVCGG
ncbi:hypothetical protein GCM10010492_43670 [Saccharothrix mutabilis subsp. mutabilis]|uniref:Uncharacterized protein n=1 Tax=Saccharothrix mutabilis subsp. mutabilis TaxID=66855 RepID=A0ABN0U5Y6_9PSEU